MVGQTTELTYLTDPSFSTVNTPCDTGAPCNVCTPRCSLPETTLYVPLQFWFCRNPGLALPLIALQYHEVKINLELNGLDCLLCDPRVVNPASPRSVTSRTLKVRVAWACIDLREHHLKVGAVGKVTIARNGALHTATEVGLTIESLFNRFCLLWAVDSLTGVGPYGSSNKTTQGAYTKSLVAASLYVDYVFLDTDEPRGASSRRTGGQCADHQSQPLRSRSC